MYLIINPLSFASVILLLLTQNVSSTKESDQVTNIRKNLYENPFKELKVNDNKVINGVIAFNQRIKRQSGNSRRNRYYPYPVPITILSGGGFGPRAFGARGPAARGFGVRGFGARGFGGRGIGGLGRGIGGFGGRGRG